MAKAGDVATTLDEALARGRRAWPGVELPDGAYARFLEARKALRPGDDEREPHDDLYLACACLLGVPAAREALDRTIMADVPKAIRRVSAEPDFVNDVAADLRLALLDGAEGKASALAQYRGQGPLRSFVMVLAMRRAVDRKRRQKEIVTEPHSMPDAGAENTGIARVDASELKAAFLEALREKLAALQPRDRTILRLHVVDGVSAEAIGRMYGVHRATATRWIVDAKQLVFDKTRDALQQRFKVSPDTFESFARQEALGLDAELSTFLRVVPEDET